MIEHISLALKCPIVASTTKLVLIALCDMANQDGVCWPSKAALAEVASVSQRSIGRMTAELEAKGLIRVWVDPQGIKTNRYWIDTESIRKTVSVIDHKARKAASDAALKSFEECCRVATPVSTGLFQDAATPRQSARHPATPMSTGSTSKPPSNQNPAPRSANAAAAGAEQEPEHPSDKPSKPQSDSSAWVRPLWEARYARKYPGVSPPWGGREGACAKAIAGAVRDTVRRSLGKDASEDAIARKAVERLGAAMDGFLALTNEDDRYVVSKCHPFVALKDRLPMLLSRTVSKVQNGSWT